MLREIPKDYARSIRILILNWRDVKNPSSGGAEILTQEMAKRWVKLGHEVTQFSSSFKGSKKEEVIDGVKLIRRGRWWSVHILAFFYYFKNFRTKADAVIDEVHWFPFFALLYARQKVILLVCEVATDLFSSFFPLSLSIIFKIFEKTYLRLYKNVPTLAISASTKNDLIKKGFSENSITILPMGVSVPKNINILPKEKNKTLVYVGRLTKLKGIGDAMLVLKLIRRELPETKLWIIGRGEAHYVKKLKDGAKYLGIIDSVIFYDFVSEEKKFSLMSRAHILLVPSAHEGWGLIVHEAGIVGTPAVVYNVEGLRDVVKDGENGILVRQNPRAMANKVKELLLNKDLYAEIKQQAMSHAKKMNWDNTANKGLRIIKKLSQ